MCVCVCVYIYIYICVYIKVTNKLLTYKSDIICK